MTQAAALSRHNGSPFTHSSNWMSAVVASANLNAAMDAVYQKRQKDSSNSDIWSVHLNWASLRAHLQANLLAGCYQLSPVQVYVIDGQRVTRWSSLDAVALKAMAQIIQPEVANYVGTQCHHLKGHGGLKGGVRAVDAAVENYHFVLRSDVAQFYQSMEKDSVLRECKALIQDRRILQIIRQVIERVEIYQGDHQLIEHGLPKGCALSPLIGALMLKSLGAGLPAGSFLSVYMDDWVILTKTKRQLRRAVKWMHRVMRHNGFKLALAKTFIGKIARGFDYLGYRFNHQGLVGLADKTIANFKQKLRRLYEQRASQERVLQYVRRWEAWCISGCEIEAPQRAKWKK